MGFILLNHYVSLSKQETTNFIEFGNDRLIFQTSTAFKQQKIEITYSEITQILVGMQEIEIQKQNAKSIKIPVSTSEYAQRIAFKHQFELLKAKLGV